LADGDDSEKPVDPSGWPTLESPQVSAQPAPAGAGLRSIGPYRLVRRIGEGGMGQVWLAQQTAPVQRQVALKLLRAGLYDLSILQRFQSERQALAMMDHPSIAKVFDAGATPDGQPYFVMEYVPGQPITRYCDQHRLGILERLDLFVKTCEGVQHAHQKAILHRDLKPANILVVEVDGKPEPRIIDFGMAKAISPEVEGATLFTQAGTPVGTPGYMSPEQADPGMAGVDTRSDVYSLGVVLYVLLTGLQPFDTEPGTKRPLSEVIRQLREEDPPRPSRRIGGLGGAADTVADRRGTRPAPLVRLLEGDLDWITLKALDRDRDRRYGAPSELAADIGRYLRNETVVARPASAGYRLRKYTRRHRVGVALAAGLALLLVGFAGMQAVQLRRIERERDRANRITDFMTRMFKVSSPSESRGNSVTAREILDRASTEIASGLARDPQTQGQLMFTMGTVYRDLGLYGRARDLLERASGVQRDALGADNPETLASEIALADTMARTGRQADAEVLARRTLASARRALGSRHRVAIDAMNVLAVILGIEGRYSEAEPLAREALDTAQAVLGPAHSDLVRYRSGLASVLADLGRLPEAEALTREALQAERAALGPEHPDTLHMMNNLAAMLGNQGRQVEAERIQREVVEIERRVLGPDHPETVFAMGNLANYLADQGRYAEAERMQRDVLAANRRSLGPEHPETLRVMANLVNTLSGEKRYDEAETLQRETLEIETRVLGPDHPWVGMGFYDLACIKALRGSRDEALAALRQSLDHGMPATTAQGIADDEELKSLHGDPRFDAIVAEARKRLSNR